MRLGFLRPLYAGEDDCASIYLDTSRTTEDAAERDPLFDRPIGDGHQDFNWLAIGVLQLDRQRHEEESFCVGWPGRWRQATADYRVRENGPDGVRNR